MVEADPERAAQPEPAVRPRQVRTGHRPALAAVRVEAELGVRLGAEPEIAGDPHAHAAARPQLGVRLGLRGAALGVALGVADEAEVDQQLHGAGLVRRDEVALDAHVVALDDVALDRDADKRRERGSIDRILRHQAVA